MTSSTRATPRLDVEARFQSLGSSVPSIAVPGEFQAQAPAKALKILFPGQSFSPLRVRPSAESPAA